MFQTFRTCLFRFPDTNNQIIEKDGMKINEELFAQAHQAMQVLRQPLKLKQVVELTSVIVIYRI